MNSNAKTVKPRTGIDSSMSDRIFYWVVNVCMVFVFIIILYPLIYIVSASLSSTSAILAGRVVLWPVEINLAGYRTVFRYNGIITGLLNSGLYVVLGTTINVCVTMCCSYALARKTLLFRRFLTLLFTFTMFFSGGLIPSYMLMRDLNVINSRWAVILPGMMSVYNMILARTYIQSSIPGELLEAARMDGCSDFRFFFQMVIPLSKAIIAVITLYYAISHWNGWFNAFIYLDDRKLYPLQLFLREILVNNDMAMESFSEVGASSDSASEASLIGMQELMKYAMIVISSLPAMILYPFIQKYFVTGVMIGSLKG